MTGMLRHRDLGPGLWVLVTDQGEELELEGRVPPELKDQRVVVEGSRRESWGWGMVGATLVLRQIRRA
jgi:hypothetical protein